MSETIQCPNCSKPHTNRGNCYCEKCASRFASWGMPSIITSEGELKRDVESKGCEHRQEDVQS